MNYCKHEWFYNKIETDNSIRFMITCEKCNKTTLELYGVNYIPDERCINHK